MLEFYFSYRGVLKRLRNGALGTEMDRIVRDLFSLGYKRASDKLYLSRIARLSHFAAAHCGSGPIGVAIVDSYLRTFTTDSSRIAAVTALQHARRVAPERFITSAPGVVDDPDAPLLSSYSAYLSRVRRLEPKSRDGVLLGARPSATPIDLRDRAILLLLATTGIRNGELHALQRQDIDWRAGEVFVRHTKGKRDRVAPLLEETGAALADYILRARPKVDSAYLFLSFTPPVGPVRGACVEDCAEAVAAWRDGAR